MIAQTKFFATAAFAAAFLAACGGGSPRDQIVTACVEAEDQQNTREQCVCFADQLDANLNDEDLAYLAEAMSAPEDERERYEEALADNQGMAMAMIGAAKECSLSAEG